MIASECLNCEERIKKNVINTVMEQLKELQLQSEKQKILRRLCGIRTHDLCDSDANAPLLSWPEADSFPVVSLGKTQETRAGNRRGTREAREMRTREREKLIFTRPINSVFGAL